MVCGWFPRIAESPSESRESPCFSPCGRTILAPGGVFVARRVLLRLHDNAVGCRVRGWLVDSQSTGDLEDQPVCRPEWFFAEIGTAAVTLPNDRGATQRSFSFRSRRVQANIRNLRRAGISPLARGREHPDPFLAARAQARVGSGGEAPGNQFSEAPNGRRLGKPDVVRSSAGEDVRVRNPGSRDRGESPGEETRAELRRSKGRRTGTNARAIEPDASKRLTRLVRGGGDRVNPRSVGRDETSPARRRAKQDVEGVRIPRDGTCRRLESPGNAGALRCMR